MDFKTKAKTKTSNRQGKVKDFKPRNFDEQKMILKRKLDENTEKLDAIKKAKKNFQRKTIVLK